MAITRYSVLQLLLITFALIALINFADANNNNHNHQNIDNQIDKLNIQQQLESDESLRSMAHRTGAPRSMPQRKSLTENKWFKQRLDHFSYDNTTWNQRYSVNSSYWSPGKQNPIFLFLAGEAPEGFFGFQEVQALLWAQQFEAQYVVLEHRFYGESLPFRSMTTQNLKYLNSQQAIADAAYFIEQYNATLDTPGPWVVFGCSYSGALSAWLRAKYPNSVVASVAPSGPVNAYANFTGYYGWFETAAADQPGCVNAVKQAVSTISQMLSTPSGTKQLETTFRSCKPITNSTSWYFKFRLMEQVGGSDQMDNPPDWPLNQTCSVMTSSSDPVTNWAKLFGTSGCNSFDPQSAVDGLRLTIPNANRAWFWQTCNEFGWLKPSYPGTSIFWGDVPLDNLLAACAAVFGIPNMQPDVDWTNSYYGGPNLLASEVMFTNGMKDPWHLVSISQDVPPPSEVQAVTYDLGHCATMIAATPDDTPALIAARQAVTNFLANALKKSKITH